MELHGFSHFFFRPLLWPRLLNCVICFLVLLEMSFVAFPRFLPISLMCANSLCSLNVMTFVSAPRRQVLFVCWLVSGPGSVFTCLCSSSALFLVVAVAFSVVSGVPMVQLVLSLGIPLIFAFEPVFSPIAFHFLFLPRGCLYWKYCVGIFAHPLFI